MFNVANYGENVAVGSSADIVFVLFMHLPASLRHEDVQTDLISSRVEWVVWMCRVGVSSVDRTTAMLVIFLFLWFVFCFVLEVEILSR